MSDYIVISTQYERNDESVGTLVMLVNEKIEQGYEPIGGVAVRTGGLSGAYYMQAMFRSKKIAQEKQE